MMKDFTYNSFKNILIGFQSANYKISGFHDYLKVDNTNPKQLILRHDVDRFPLHSLEMAQMEANLGITATYYFRIIPSVFKPEIIREIAVLGHEIGYHYEDLSLCKGDTKMAIKHFETSLEKLRNLYPVDTICMHGSPLSKSDNKTIWNHYNYKNYGIVGDTSFDIDYNKVFYITDNGRAWNRFNVSVRDKVQTSFSIPINDSAHFNQLIQNQKLPNSIMINAHPDTFFHPGLKWFLNYGFIESKNIIKWVIVRYKIRK